MNMMTIDCCVVFRCVCMFILVYEAFLCARTRPSAALAAAPSLVVVVVVVELSLCVMSLLNHTLCVLVSFF